MGFAVGSCVGFAVGSGVGFAVGSLVGRGVGKGDGSGVVGRGVGTLVGRGVGAKSSVMLASDQSGFENADATTEAFASPVVFPFFWSKVVKVPL